jgi:hypothetical protein
MQELVEQVAMQDGTGHGAETKLGQLDSLGRQKSSYCRPYRGLVRHHTCGHQGLRQQTVALDLWRCKSGARDRGALSMEADKRL